MTIDILGITRGLVGRRSKITRQQMTDILVALAEAGLYLGNGYMSGTVLYDSPDGMTGQSTDEPHPGAPVAWANACTRITCISVSESGLRDGNVRYDEPGSMHPMQQSTLTFAPATLCDHAYMRRHCLRLLIVRDDPPLPEYDLRTVLLRREVVAWTKARNECDEGAIHLTDSRYASHCALPVLSALHMLRHELERARGPMSGREVIVHLAPIIRLATGEAQDRLRAITQDERLEIPGIPAYMRTSVSDDDDGIDLSDNPEVTAEMFAKATIRRGIV